MNSQFSIHEKILPLVPGFELMPGVVIIHEVESMSVEYMSSKGLQQLGVTLRELQEMSVQYYHKFFNFEDSEFLIERLSKLLQNGNMEEPFSYFQQVKFKDKKDWVWHISSTRLFHRDENNKPTHILTISVPIWEMKHIPHKAERLLAENMFYKNNINKYKSLGKRAKEILKLVAIGKSSPEIAHELFISIETVSTHRKLIKQKLGIHTNYEMTEYARAFDLI